MATLFPIRRNASTTLTQQICREFSDRITTGILEPGNRLPSVRSLSETLGVSLVTVVHAYRMLETDGFVERVHGKGTFVRPTGSTPTGSTSVVPAFDWQLSIPDYLPRASMMRQHGRTGGTETPFKMSMASLNPALSVAYLPNLDSVFRNESHHLAEYAPVEGLESLRRDIALYLRENGLPTTAEEILITNGVQQAIDIVARTFVGPGDVVVVEGPTYAGAIDVFRARGATLVSIPMDDEGIRIDLLLKQCDRTPPKLIYTMPTFQNPTGLVMSARRRAQLRDVVESYQCLLVEDDSFAECSFTGRTPPPIRAADTTGHVIYLRGFSKVFYAGCRIAAVVSSGSVRNRLVAAKSVADLGSPTITQSIMQQCLAQPNRRQRIAHLALSVQRKRDIALQVLAREAPAGVSWTVPLGGYNIWITLPAHVDTDPLLVEALHRGVSFLPGAACHANETVHNQLRISIAWLDDEALREGISRLCTLLGETLQAPADSYLPMI